VANDTGDASDAAAYAAWMRTDVAVPAIVLEQRFATERLGARTTDESLLDLAVNERRRARTLVTFPSVDDTATAPDLGSAGAPTPSPSRVRPSPTCDCETPWC
jgi:hypothetical protein